MPLAWNGHRLRFNLYGASLSGFAFKDSVGYAELVPPSSPGFLSTWPDLEFKPEPQSSGVAFTALHPAGVKIKKEFALSEGSLLHTVLIHLENIRPTPVALPDWSMALGPGLGTVPSEEKENPRLWRAVELPLSGNGYGQAKVRSLKDGEETSACAWAGLDNRYFLAAVVSPHAVFSKLVARRERIGAYTAPVLEFHAPALSLGPHEKRILAVKFYLGPKDYKRLLAFNQGLEKSVDFGKFTFLGKRALWVLHALYRLTRNYGVAIILLTILVQILLSPLSLKSAKASAAMRNLQPQIQQIQIKYKEDPKRLNLEMMELYKAKGVNPLGGCLPLLLQMPIFYALYGTLRNAWELHGAPFIFWVRDLAAPDPYFVLPILMGGAMFLQQRKNPPAADPEQAKIMQWMPALFTFMFLKLPSGLVLYWLTSNLMSLTQQSILQSRLKS